MAVQTLKDKNKVDTPLTARYELFCQSYSSCPIGRKAAIAAGYSEKTATITASTLLTLPNIQRRIKELNDELFAKIGLTKENILGDMVLLAKHDIRKLYDEDGNLRPIHALSREEAIAITGIEVDELWEMEGRRRVQSGVTRKIKIIDKKGAQDTLIKVAGWAAPDKVAQTDVAGNDVKKQVIKINGKEIEF